MRDFRQWFDNKEFYLWSTGNYLDPTDVNDSKMSVKQRIVYQLALRTTLGLKSEVYYEVNMAEVKTKHAGDTIFGSDRSEAKVGQRFLNTQRTLQRESLLTGDSVEKFQFSIYFTLSNKLEVYEFTTPSLYPLWFELGGLLFLIHLFVGIILRPYSDLFLERDLLNKAFRIDSKEKDKLVSKHTLARVGSIGGPGAG